ncbi:TetR/AcrR family transcriptional regulator [Nocardioides mangrovicus]|uniref:TetR/AcrR family transcriptional regulator n=1 Tax=Nocardioides mangrovicus TaxID=2478913 RepID=A0A3L8P516_9ACTN|nr:TetR/AcrR family transcriptional regulator [Nocardioides mangrovicus]RLV50132.1 TetR/AcrR family transcriptional regulator [Nocardioides mangrovicus]
MAAASSPTTPRGADKRDRLVDGARQVFYERGVERTTIADIAEHTGIPVGNIYYYFKTKDEFVDAVVKTHADAREQLLARLGRRRTPRARLKALIEELDATRDLITDYGCPIGTLSTELNKRSGTHQALGSRELLGSMVDWVEEQFNEMGRSDARDLAVNLIATYEGATILTHSLRDPDLLHRQSQRLRRWIDSLQSAAG